MSVDGDVSLIFAGWLPQDGAFGSERHACLESSVTDRLVSAAHSCIANRSGRYVTPSMTVPRAKFVGLDVSRRGRPGNQHQPASSRSIEALDGALLAGLELVPAVAEPSVTQITAGPGRR